MAVLKYTTDGTVWQPIPAGPEGAPGPVGPQGPQGIQGPAGPAEVVVTHPNGTDVLVVAGGQTVHYDSGWRDISALIANGWAPIYGSARIRRVNSTVMWSGHIDGTAYTSDHFTATAMPGFMADGYGTVTTHNVAPWANYVTSTSTDYYIGGAAHTIYALTIQVATSDPIPTSLPGTLVSAAPG